MTVDYTFVPGAQADWYLLLRNSGTARQERRYLGEWIACGMPSAPTSTR